MATSKQKKIAAACEKMKEFGISKAKVKKAIEELLKVYCDNWEFIEDDDYRVLMDAVLEKKDEDKETKCNRKEAGSNSKKNEVKSRKEAQKHDDPLISELQKKRLRPRNQKGKAVTSIKRLKTDMLKTSPILEKHESELSCGFQTTSEEDREHLVRRKSTSNQKQVVVYEDSIYHGDRFCSWPAENSLKGQEDGFSSFEDSEPLRKRPRSYDKKKNDRDYLYCQSNGKNPLNSEFSFEKQQSEFCTNQIVTENILDFYHNDCLDFPSGEAYDYDLPVDEVPLKLIHPASSTGNSNDVMEEETRLLQFEPLNEDNKGSYVSSTSQFDIASSTGNSNDVMEEDTRLLQFEPLNEDNKGSYVSSTSQFDIASSSNGEVKVSLICNPSQSELHIPSLDAVLKAVEEKYKLHKIMDSDFSVMKLMKDVCECFLAMAAPSSVDKCLWIDNMSMSKGSDGTNDSGNNICNHLNYSNCFACFQNLVKIVPQIPNPVALSGLEGLHYICGFRISDIVDNPRIITLDGTEFINSSIMAGIEKGYFSSAEKCCYIDDIARGEERVKISLVNSFGAEQLSTFYYIQHNLVYDKAHVKFALAHISDVECCSKCFGDCLAVSLPCACARISGGEYAYTQEGLVKEKFLEECISLVKDPEEHNFFDCKRCPLEMAKNKQKVKHCKGHLLRKFIKECWSKCGCNKNCGNRVVQRGITRNLQVFWTQEGKGWGVRTLEDLPKGAFVCEYVGEVLTNMEVYERIVQNKGKEKHTYPVLLDADWCSESIMKDEEALCLDATLYGNVSRFINHRCTDASLIEIPVEVETPDHHYYHLALFTKRTIAAMEELTWDYGIDFNDQDHYVNVFGCLCNSSLCRDQRQKK